MLLAKKLQKGDTIGVVTPSNLISKDKTKFIENAKKYFEDKRFKIVFGNNAFSVDKYGISGGSPQERADDINGMFVNKEINAIWCVQGGNTANEILDLLDYDKIKKNPKIILGKSDVDLLLMAINKKTSLVTFHAPDFKLGRGKEMDFEYSQKWFDKRLINGEIGEIEKATEWKCVREGKATGRIIGCNLSSIMKLVGTDYFPDFKNSILFLEGYTEDIKRLTYRLTQLKQVGLFDKIKGVVISYIYGFQDKEQLLKNPKLDKEGNKVNYEDVVLDLLQEYDFPILKINEFGHYFPNAIIPIGVKVELDASNKSIKIIENCLE
jgi:muramoyltetrapeptide carboxypeptidase